MKGKESKEYSLGDSYAVVIANTFWKFTVFGDSISKRFRYVTFFNPDNMLWDSFFSRLYFLEQF